MYQLLQLSPAALKKAFRQTKDRHQQRKLVGALVLRSVLVIAFAISYISLFTLLFGTANSSVAVGSFCILLGLRFVSYGYHIVESILALAVVLGLMFLGGVVSLWANPFWSLVTNFLALAIILLLTTKEPVMGNGGIYVFSYLFISQTPVHQHALVLRGLGLIAVFLLCSHVLHQKHREKDRQLHWRDVLGEFNWRQEKSQWQMRLALGVSSALFFGEMLHLPRVVWLGYASMSVLLSVKGDRQQRAFHRVFGVLLGSLLFGIVAYFLPVTHHFLLGPLAGLCIGFSATYFWNNVLNCFGALLLASSLYGLPGAIVLRIGDNLLGAGYALLFILFFECLLRQKNSTQSR